jgi:hypothetical protein
VIGHEQPPRRRPPHLGVSTLVTGTPMAMPEAAQISQIGAPK